jgi:fermentation-respiration switch protein FrsA (DUF1100 family)
MLRGMCVPALKLIVVGFLFILAVVPLFHAFLNVYRPKLPIYSTPEEDGLKFDSISFPTSDGEILRGWFLHGRISLPLVVVCHGVGTNREDLRAVSRFLGRAGFSVLAFDFRAHGQSSGHKTTFGFKEALDVQAAVRFAQKGYGSNFKNIGIYAISMGSAAVILASPNLPEVRAFVFDSSFATLSELVDLQFVYLPAPLRTLFAYLTRVYGWLLTGVAVDEIAPEKFVMHLGARPVLVFHGGRDTLIPISQGKRLFGKIAGPKEFVETPGGTHVQSYFRTGKAYEEKVVDFFRRHLQDDSKQ